MFLPLLLFYNLDELVQDYTAAEIHQLQLQKGIKYVPTANCEKNTKF
jgi:hypothetical protein